METVLYDLNDLNESSRNELAAYRSVGSVHEIRRLKRQERRRHRRIERNLQLLGNTFTGICATFILWVFASWVDVILHNLDPNPVYQAWNFFVIFF